MAMLVFHDLESFYSILVGLIYFPIYLLLAKCPCVAMDESKIVISEWEHKTTMLIEVYIVKTNLSRANKTLTW